MVFGLSARSGQVQEKPEKNVKLWKPKKRFNYFLVGYFILSMSNTRVTNILSHTFTINNVLQTHWINRVLDL